MEATAAPKDDVTRTIQSSFFAIPPCVFFLRQPRSLELGVLVRVNEPGQSQGGPVRGGKIGPTLLLKTVACTVQQAVATSGFETRYRVATHLDSNAISPEAMLELPR